MGCDHREGLCDCQQVWLYSQWKNERLRSFHRRAQSSKVVPVLANLKATYNPILVGAEGGPNWILSYKSEMLKPSSRFTILSSIDDFGPADPVVREFSLSTPMSLRVPMRMD